MYKNIYRTLSVSKYDFQNVDFNAWFTPGDTLVAVVPFTDGVTLVFMKRDLINQDIQYATESNMSAITGENVAKPVS